MGRLLYIFIASTLVLFAQTARAGAVNIVTNCGDVQIPVEVADNPEMLKIGLMHRRKLDEKAGMLFVFPKIKEASMWMKNTHIPLDMLFISADRHVANIIENAVPESENIIYSGVQVKYALEVNAGFARKNCINIGNIVEF